MTQKLNVTLAAIKSLDLSVIERQLERDGWGAERTEDAVSGYRAFLARVASSKSGVEPEPDVDEVWHAHLNTERYAEDCLKIFGVMLHHLRQKSADLCVSSIETQNLCVSSLDVRPALATPSHLSLSQ